MWALYKSLNLDLNLDPNKLDLGLGLVLGWGQTRGAPIKGKTASELGLNRTATALGSEYVKSLDWKEGARWDLLPIPGS